MSVVGVRLMRLQDCVCGICAGFYPDMNEKTKEHDECDKDCCKGLSTALSSLSNPHHSSIQTWLPLQSFCTDKPTDEGDCSFEKKSNKRPSSDVFHEEVFCPGLASDALAFIARSGPHSDVVKEGYLGKQEQKDKRYFVLRAGSHCGPSRLEWYKTQEKFAAVEKSACKMMLFGSRKQRFVQVPFLFTLNDPQTLMAKLCFTG